MASTYKKTMNLPKTGFAMKANLPLNEPKRLEWWESKKIYWQVLDKNKEGKPFVLHDGPPYANGPIHIGHAFNKILKDFVVKSHAQRGFYTPYIPGWDCHGQPIEHMVEEKLGPEKMKTLPQPTIRRLCREWAEKYIDIQRDSFKRLGVNADWEHPYLTFLPDYEAGNVEIFKKLYLDGAIYRGRKPIHWCKHCHTALSEAEIEYGDETSPSIYVDFLMDEMPQAFAEAGASGDVWVLIWTTTPWTLPANSAVCLAPDAEYCLVQVEGKNHLMALDLVEEVAEVAGWSSYEIFSPTPDKPFAVRGTELAGLTYTCPFNPDLKGKIIYGNHVSLDTGTGCVHTAPGHGQDDYLVGLKFDIPLLMPVDDDGRFTNEVELFAGMDTEEANPHIIAWLREHNVLVAAKEMSHSYPHCWRCHKPVIFRATDQWFVSMEATGLRQAALDAIHNKVTWIPDWAKNRIGSMVAERPDWCISRQRSWGVPIPIFKCARCGQTVATAETFDAVIELFYREGADAWFTHEPREYLPDTTACSACGSKELIAEKDILDVWWESGVSHTSVCRHRASEGLKFPADMYLEGSDQHRGWFQSSLITSVAAYDQPPYKSVMHCGFTVDENGEKMSKSKGNGVDPADVIKKYGADVLRLWVASVDYSQDVRISDDILAQVAGTYRRFRNTFRFILGNLFDFNDERDVVSSWEDLTVIDQWMLAKTADLLYEVEQAYKQYRFHAVYHSVYDFIVNDLSAIYMEACKDRLYSEAPNSRERRSAQTVLANVLSVLVRILSPILAFTAEEVWSNYPEGMRNHPDHPESVQLAGWPCLKDFNLNIPDGALEHALEQFEPVLLLREHVMRVLEDARASKWINKSQEAALNVAAPRELLDKLEPLGSKLFEDLFVVSEIEFWEGEELAVELGLASGERCPRCWNYRILGENKNHPEVCTRCGNVLDELGFVDSSEA